MKIIKCEMRKKCEKYNKLLCFNEYKDICSRRALYLVNMLINFKNEIKKKKKKEEKNKIKKEIYKY
ncbi:MAG: hypothetical protein ACTSQJ_00495 [Promethearchaeota archaeon]